jgi:1,4-dihydroxy-2-naphthoate octaprenyltransferase
MQSRLLTIPRTDPRFMPHLLGSFSNEERALPVDLLFHDTDEERITFRIVQIDAIDCPGKVMTFLTGVRPMLLLLTMGPAATSIFYAITFGWEIEIGIAACTLMAVFFLHGAAFLMNDYCDHLSGTDRLSSFRRESHCSAWMGYRRKGQKMVLDVLGVGLDVWPALPLASSLAHDVVYWRNSGSDCPWLFLYAPKCEVFGLGQFNGFFFGMGPLLTAGTLFAVTARIGSEVLIFGAIFGFGASLCIQLRNFETMLADSQMRTRTLMSRLGLEKSKLVVMAQLFFILCLMSLFVYMETASAIYWLVLTPVFGVAVHLGLRVWSVGSPLSSRVERSLEARSRSASFASWPRVICFYIFLYLSRT